MNNSLEKLDKVFDISDLLYAQEKEKSIAKLNEELEKEFQSGSVTYSTLQIYFMVILKTIKQLINCRVAFDIKEVNNLIERKINKSLSSIIFKRISKRSLQTIEEEFQYLIDEVTYFSKDHDFPDYMLDWINEEVDKEKALILKYTKKIEQPSKINSALKYTTTLWIMNRLSLQRICILIVGRIMNDGGFDGS